MQESSIFLDMYKHLLLCIEKFELEMKNNISNVSPGNTQLEHQLSIEQSKNYHYTEILKHINVIKLELQSIKYHDDKLQFLKTNPSKELYDRKMKSKSMLEDINYVKAQVQNFSTLAQVPVRKRENKPVRKTNELSSQSLTLWEKFLERQKIQYSELHPNTNNTNTLPVMKRSIENGRKKHNKLVSSTFEGVLDMDYVSDLIAISEAKECEDYHHNNNISNNNKETSNNNNSNSNPDIKLTENKPKIEYFNDLFTNCDDLIENINNKHFEVKFLNKHDGTCEENIDLSEHKNDNYGKYNDANNYKHRNKNKVTQEEHATGNPPDEIDTKPRIIDVVYKKK